MNEKKAKELTDSIFDKLNDQERVYLAWVHNQKNKEIQELKEENEFLKLSNPEMNIEHFRYVKENKRKIDNLRLVNKRLNNIINELEKDMNRDDLSYVETQYVLDKIKELKGSDKEMNKNKKGIGIIPTTIITFKESIESIEMSKQRKSHYEKQNINFDYPIIINNKLNFYELKMNLKKGSDKE